MKPSLVNSTVVNKRGRKPSPDSFITVSVCLTPEQWAFVRLWFPTGNVSFALRSLLDRAMKFWPAGPAAFGHVRKTARPPLYNMGVTRPLSGGAE